MKENLKIIILIIISTLVLIFGYYYPVYSSIVFLLIIIFWPLLLIVKSNKKINEILGKTDNNLYKKMEYYRDICKEISIEAIYYLRYKGIKSDLFAIMLLSLENQKYLKLENNEIYIINNNFSDLNSCEKYLMELIKNKELNQGTIKEKLYPLTEALEQDLIKYELVNKKMNAVWKMMGIWALFLCVAGILDKFLQSISVTLSIIVFISSIIIFFFQYRMLSKKIPEITLSAPTITKKGIMIFYQTLALERFLKDFSIIDERTLKEKKLWNDYMLYAIMFDFKGNLNNSTAEFYKSHIK